MVPLSDLVVVLPTLALVLAGCVVLLSEVFLTSEERGYQATLTLLGSAIAFALAVWQLVRPPETLEAFGGAARADTFQALITAIVCAGLFVTVLLSAGYLGRLKAARGEYYALLSFAAAGMSLLALSNDLVMIFVAIEAMSVATYALAAYLRRGQRPSEAAFKYFLLGAFSSGLYLYGAALAYGAVGSTRLTVLAERAASQPTLLVNASLALLLAGFAFKVAAVPFHMWAPDVYEGAPTPVTAFMAVGVKAAAFAAFFRTIAFGFAGQSDRWLPLVTVLALLTMIGGNLLALPQRNVKRMLAYSSIAHAGYLLVALASSAAGPARVSGGQGLLFYLAAYTASALGAFGIAAVVERRDPDAPNAWDLERFAGLFRRSPIMAGFMAVFMLSLAGVPPTAGFMGKLLVFRAALDAGQVTLAIVGVVTSAVGAYYYLRVVVYMYFREPEGTAEAVERSPALSWGLGLACLGVAVLGLGPGFLAEVARRSLEQLFS